ncbi:sensor histidine kinase [Actinoplanes sp. NBC_00393]|uniref:sensor histidine kinase n=1 Tax=Actinoplanes sp. NBC_00393 TaxID=2975953 RepID=UPI002E1DE866
MDTEVSRELPRPPWVLVTVVPYALLALLTVFAVVDTYTEGGPWQIDLALCALTALWMLAMFPPRPGRLSRPPVMTVLFLGLVLLNAVLVLRQPTFGFLTTAPYIYAFALLPWPWRLPAVSVVAVVAGIAQVSGVAKSDAAGIAITVIVIAVNIVIMTGMAWVLRIEERSHDDLSRANRLLEASLAENNALQTRLLAQAREAGILEERQRMAREIHDTVAQGLTGIITQLQAAEQRHEVPEPWRRPFEAVKQLARDSLTEARRSVDALRPAMLETARLSEALGEAVDHWSTLHGVPVQVTTTGTPRPLAPEAEFALLRTAQEALANIAKHASATRVGVTLSYLEHEVALDVVDDGAGFDPAGPGSGGYGLTIMRQRVEAHSGTLQIESEPGAGTGISARVPLLPTGSHR